MNEQVSRGEQYKAYCSMCGHKNSNNDRICTSCSAVLVKSKPPSPVAQPVELKTQDVVTSVCVNCNKPLKDGAKFCTTCGHSIGLGTSPTDPNQHAGELDPADLKELESNCSNCGQNFNGKPFCTSCGTSTGIDRSPMVEQSPPARKLEELDDLPELLYPEQKLFENTKLTFDSPEGKVVMTPYQFGMKYLVYENDSEKRRTSRNNFERVINGINGDFYEAQEIYQTLITRLDKNLGIVLSPRALVAVARRTYGRNDLKSGIFPVQRDWVSFMVSEYPDSFKSADDVYQKVIEKYGIKNDVLLACNAIFSKQVELTGGKVTRLGSGVDYTQAINEVGPHFNKLVMSQIKDEMKSGKDLMVIIADHKKFLEKIDADVLTS